MSTPRPGFARRGSAVGLAAALASLAAPVPARAVVNMYYKGSLIIQSFGNDTTTGSVYPYSQYIVLGVPFGLACNPNYGTQPDDACTDSQRFKGAPLTGSGVATLTALSLFLRERAVERWAGYACVGLIFLAVATALFSYGGEVDVRDGVPRSSRKDRRVGDE